MTDEHDQKTPHVETAPEAAPEAAEPLPLEEQLQRLEEEKKHLEEEKKGLFEQLLRRQADFENFRKRVERERLEFRHSVQSDLVAGLLPVLDAFERALAAGGSGSDQDYRKGVELIYKQLFDALAGAGLQVVEALGRPFDPLYHHAVERVETTEHPDHEVIGELQRGYTFRQRLLRPALVQVAVHPGLAAEPQAEEQKSED